MLKILPKNQHLSEIHLYFIIDTHLEAWQPPLRFGHPDRSSAEGALPMQIDHRRKFDIDLTAIARRAKDDPKAVGWTQEDLDDAVAEYRHFLELCHAHPQEKITTPPAVDVVWHTHILDTPRYREDCQAYFGYFLDHDVCDGVGPDTASHARTIELYAETFGKPAPVMWHAKTTCAGPGDGCGSIRQPLIGATPHLSA